MKTLTIEQLHGRLLNMAAEFHEICIVNNIPYYMLGGTMLGAIRHQGIIPWDDDMDFGIPREYFEKFINIANKSLPNQYSILTNENSDSIILGFAKISDNETLIDELFTVKGGRKLGVNIDIFPLDYSNGRRCVFSKNFYIRSMIKIQKLLHVDSHDRPFLKKVIARTAQFLVPINKCRIPRFLSKILEKRCLNKNKFTHYSNFYGAWGLKETVDIKIFGAPKKYQVGNLKLLGVEKYDEYLRCLYGNYMQLPSEEKRHLHQNRAFEI